MSGIVFFTDRDLGNTFPDMLQTAGIFVERHSPPFIAKVFQATPAEQKKKRRPIGRVELWIFGPP